jgi:transposase-like protein
MYKGIGESMTKSREKKLKGAFTPVGDGGERSEPKSPTGGGAIAQGSLSSPEVSAKSSRRKHTAEYKLRILREADACPPGGIGPLLRREGLYASQLALWRKQQESGLSDSKRGRKATNNTLVAENLRLAKELRKATEGLRKAKLIIDVQKKLCVALGLEPHPGMDAE